MMFRYVCGSPKGVALDERSFIVQLYLWCLYKTSVSFGFTFLSSIMISA